MTEVELELTYLAKYLPKDLASYPSKKIITANVPTSAAFPTLRLRQIGERYEITRKDMAEGTDSSHMLEQTIGLSAAEFAELSANSSKRTEKTRYYYPHQGLTAEIDVFEGALAGLVVVDFEFTTREAQLAFAMPDFCLVDVTQEAFIAGGMLAGKRFADITEALKPYGYKALYL